MLRESGSAPASYQCENHKGNTGLGLLLAPFCIIVTIILSGTGWALWVPWGSDAPPGPAELPPDSWAPVPDRAASALPQTHGWVSSSGKRLLGFQYSFCNSASVSLYIASHICQVSRTHPVVSAQSVVTPLCETGVGAPGSHA